MGCNGGCGGSRQTVNVDRGDSRVKTDPTAAMFASAATRYMVVRSSGDQNGKRFGTLVAAQDYARRSGGIIRQV